MEDKIRAHIIVEGRVQGVGFRYFTKENADTLNLSGWVRNRWDDTVEVVAEGERKTLDTLIGNLQRGPRTAFVSRVVVDWQKYTGEFTAFRIAPTE